MTMIIEELYHLECKTYNPVEVHQHISVIYCIHIQDQRKSKQETIMKQAASSASTELHDITSQQVVMSTSNPATIIVCVLKLGF
jgi:hypothetical protein